MFEVVLIRSDKFPTASPRLELRAMNLVRAASGFVRALDPSRALLNNILVWRGLGLGQLCKNMPFYFSCVTLPVFGENPFGGTMSKSIKKENANTKQQKMNRDEYNREAHHLISDIKISGIQFQKTYPKNHIFKCSTLEFSKYSNFSSKTHGVFAFLRFASLRFSLLVPKRFFSTRLRTERLDGKHRGTAAVKETQHGRAKKRRHFCSFFLTKRRLLFFVDTMEELVRNNAMNKVQYLQMDNKKGSNDPWRSPLLVLTILTHFYIECWMEMPHSPFIPLDTKIET